MRVWLITVGEPLPTDPGVQRLHRTGVLAEALRERGHEVTWWTSSFDHVAKRHRVVTDAAQGSGDGLRLRLLHGPGYRSNVSVARLWDHWVLGRQFRALAPLEPTPDVILCSLPTLELSQEAVAFGRPRGVPVVLDVRDMWPDVFRWAAPGWSADLMSAALLPYERMADCACGLATAITGHAPGFVEWGLRHARRLRGPWDRDFPFGYDARRPRAEDLDRAHALWEARGVGVNPKEFVVAFAGAIGRQFDFAPVLDAARRLQGRCPVQFVLCGSGDRLDQWQGRASGLKNVFFPGWVERPEIFALMERSHLGLAPYVDRADYAASIPNKGPEYLSGGLPIALSLGDGVLADIIDAAEVGFSYAGQGTVLAREIERMWLAPDRQKAMSDRARTLFRERFDAQKVYEGFAEYLERLAFADAGR